MIQPVKMYINWYMMWYLKKDMFCREHIFSDHSSFLKCLSVIRFLVSLAVVCRPADTFHVELVPASARVSCALEILRWRAQLHLVIVCKARGLNPGPTKKVVRTIVHVIAKYDCPYDRKN